MQRIKFMFKHFLKKPLWFKMLVSITLLISIIFSSSLFTINGYNQSLAKFATAIFFLVIGINMRSNKQISAIFFVVAAICIYLSWDSFKLARL